MWAKWGQSKTKCLSSPNALVPHKVQRRRCRGTAGLASLPCHHGCSYGWAAQVLKCFAEHGKSSLLVAGAPVEVQPDELQLSFQMQRQAAFDAVPLDPRSCPGPGVKLCTYRRWFSRPAHQVCPVYWEVPMSTAKLQRILRFRMGSHLLPIEQGRHLRLPRQACV